MLIDAFHKVCMWKGRIGLRVYATEILEWGVGRTSRSQCKIRVLEWLIDSEELDDEMGEHERWVFNMQYNCYCI